jgi:poly(A) polymerase
VPADRTPPRRGAGSCGRRGGRVAPEQALADLVRLAPVLDELGNRFAESGHSLYLVGGSVRDALLGRLAADRDIDLATDARPAQVTDLLRGWAESVWETGIAFGTVGAAARGYQVEVTTFRSDVYRRHSRKPEVRFGERLEDDLVRRDFTVNAMALPLPLGTAAGLIDPFGGLADLDAGRLDTPGAPEGSFDDDPLRMLRAARFRSELGFSVAPRVVAAIAAMSGRIEIVSAERIRDELSKLLLGGQPRLGLTLLTDTGLAACTAVLPELPALRLEIDEHHHHKDVYEHTLTVLDQAIAREPSGPDLTLRWAAVLHDVGKPKTRWLRPDGKVAFHHHEVVGASMARDRLTALRYPRSLVEDVARLVELHLRFHGYGGGQWTDSAVRRYVRDAGPLLDRLHLLVRSDCTTRNRQRAAALGAAYDALERRIAELSAKEELARVRPDLSGDDIMRELGLRPGPLVGEARQHLLELRLEHGPLGYQAAVRALHEWAAERGLEPDHPNGSSE